MRKKTSARKKPKPAANAVTPCPEFFAAAGFHAVRWGSSRFPTRMRWRRRPTKPGTKAPEGMYADFGLLEAGGCRLSVSDGHSGDWETVDYPTLEDAQAGYITWMLTGELTPP